MKNKHYDIIVAKADDMSLILFYGASKKWGVAASELMSSFHPETEYFLCLPQHQEACLHWLNGGEVQIHNGHEFKGFKLHSSWHGNHQFMVDLNIRIKPKKEKRWIGFYSNNCVTDKSYKDKSALITFIKTSRIYEYCAFEKWQFFEIDVEV